MRLVLAKLSNFRAYGTVKNCAIACSGNCDEEEKEQVAEDEQAPDPACGCTAKCRGVGRDKDCQMVCDTACEVINFIVSS